LLSVDFYQIFLSFEYILILQTDAVLLNSSLLDWCSRGFHYVGAPLGIQVNVNAPELLADLFPAHSPFRSRLPVGTVGNGGLSLRHVRRTIELLQSNATLAGALSQAGLPEDLFFMLGGVGVEDFRVPNEATAARFALEMHGPEYIKIGYPLPLGLHGWARFDKAFWLTQFSHMGLFPAPE
jgi:hypothetical protein